MLFEIRYLLYRLLYVYMSRLIANPHSFITYVDCILSTKILYFLTIVIMADYHL